MKVSVSNRQRKLPVRLAWLRRIANKALPECLRHPARKGAPLQHLEAVEAVVVSDRVIAEVHAQFFDDPTPTDVITFDHGEILVSAETAAANAFRYKTGVNEELGLYIIHGMLHLNGFTDKTPAARKRMHTVQSRIFRKCLAALSLVAVALAPAWGADDAPPLDENAMLESLRVIRGQQQKGMSDQQARVLQQINAAAATPQSAKAFYEEAVQQTRFAGLNREHAQFRDWKKQQEEGRGRELPQNSEVIRLHLVYLAATLQHSFGARPASLAGPLMRYTSTVNSLKPEDRDSPLMKDPLNGSLFVHWLALGSFLGGGEGGWEMVPRNTDGIWEKSILPVLRERKDPLAVDYWNSRIQRESESVADTDRAFDAARFAGIRKPELLWNRSQEMLAIGQRNRALAEMLAIVKTNPTHPRAGEWIASIEQLLKAGKETPAPAAPGA